MIYKEHYCSLGDYVLESIDEKGLTIKKAARICRVSEYHLKKLIDDYGHITCNVKVIERIIRGLNLNRELVLEDLIHDDYKNRHLKILRALRAKYNDMIDWRTDSSGRLQLLILL